MPGRQRPHSADDPLRVAAMVGPGTQVDQGAHGHGVLQRPNEFVHALGWSSGAGEGASGVCP